MTFSLMNNTPVFQVFRDNLVNVEVSFIIYFIKRRLKKNHYVPINRFIGTIIIGDN